MNILTYCTVKGRYNSHLQNTLKKQFLIERSATDHIFCICQTLEKKWEYSEAAHQLFIYFRYAYDSVRREVLYNIIIQLDMPIKLVRLIKM
jgi:hypothetical protein